MKLPTTSRAWETIPNNDKPQFIREAAPTFATTAVADAVAVATVAVAVGTDAAAADFATTAAR